IVWNDLIFLLLLFTCGFIFLVNDEFFLCTFAPFYLFNTNKHLKSFCSEFFKMFF
uniref:Uncharacterized protein n=1 Tax=Marmota marmota marmota TaxID=9994 RepID=A0A8C5ZK83_MARMA